MISDYLMKTIFDDIVCKELIWQGQFLRAYYIFHIRKYAKSVVVLPIGILTGEREITSFTEWVKNLTKEQVFEIVKDLTFNQTDNYVAADHQYYLRNSL